MKLKLTRKTGPDVKKKKIIVMRLNRLSENTRKTELAVVKDAPPVLAREPGNLTLNFSRKIKPGAASPTVVDEKEKKKWKARSFSGRHLPVLQCNNCSLSRVCPKFKAGYECAFLPFLNSHKVESPSDLVKYMKEFVGNSMRRAQMMSIVETANGGMPSLETSEALDMAFRQLKDLHGVMSDGTEDTLTIEGDASLVGSIFGGMKLEKLREETSKMHLADPVLALPHVPEAPTPLAQQTLEANIAQDLLRDAILNGSKAANSKKDLRSLPDVSIEVSEVTKLRQ